MSATEESTQTANLAACAAADKLATNIVAIDVSDQLGICDVFVIASAENERQVSAVVDFVEEVLLRVGTKPLRREGKMSARWVLLDYGDVVVHVQHVEERAHYALERIWGDCQVLALDLDAPLPEAPERGADVIDWAAQEGILETESALERDEIDALEAAIAAGEFEGLLEE